VLQSAYPQSSVRIHDVVFQFQTFKDPGYDGDKDSTAILEEVKNLLTMRGRGVGRRNSVPGCAHLSDVLAYYGELSSGLGRRLLLFVDCIVVNAW
jgi:hypothetical protein